MSAAVAKVVFTPSGKRGTFAHGTAVLDAARQLGVDVDSVCGGRGLCGRCQVECSEGEFPKHNIDSRIGNLSERSSREQDFSERRHKPLADGRRLGCQARILGDLVIDVPAESQVHQQLVSKAAEHRDISLDPVVRLYYVDVQPATLHSGNGDAGRLLQALQTQWQLDGISVDAYVLPGLQWALRDSDWKVTVAVCERRVIAVFPGVKTAIYGVALDIGSTTIAAQLCNLVTGEVLAASGIMNPQIRFGEDLMSRVSYVMMHEDGAYGLKQAVRDGVNKLLAQVAESAQVEMHDVLALTVAGNPIMHHLFLGISPVELGAAPFALAIDSAMTLKAADLEMAVNPAASVYVLPCIAGHVGADAAAMVLAEEPQQQAAMSLVVDVGTNAEIVLGNNERVLACSSPTGPAFEGAQVSCGQRAAPGAIERVRIDRQDLSVRFRVIGSELWSDDEGFADVEQSLGVTGICGSGIIEAVAEMYLAGVLDEDGVIDGALAERTDRIFAAARTYSFRLYKGEHDIVVTQNDVRQIQLAKAALYAGARLLMDKAGVAEVDRIRLAGAFGSHIDPQYAMVLGLIPDCDLAAVSSAGNAAGTGARIALLNVAARREIEALVADIEKIETALEDDFQRYFVDAMALPNKSDAFPKLFAVVDKPIARQSLLQHRQQRRTRRRRRARSP